MNRLQLTGRKFGRLLALKDAGNNAGGKSTWFCACDCGNTHVTSSSHLLSGSARSCGHCPKTIDEQLWQFVNKNGPLPEQFPEFGPCWIWTRAKHGAGYGVVQWDNKTKLVHRVVYTLIRGTIPDYMTLDHLCRNRICCNPEHFRSCNSSGKQTAGI